jgi:hypothetical protein
MRAKPVPDLVAHLARLKRTGSKVPGPEDISFEDALQELIKLVREERGD